MNISADPPRENVQPPLRFKKKFTSRQRTDCIRLREFWIKNNDRLAAEGHERLSLKRLSTSSGKSLSVAAHYFNGTNALNVEWKMRFAEALEIAPQVVWPDWEFSQLTYVTIFDARRLKELPASVNQSATEKDRKRKKPKARIKLKNFTKRVA